MNENSEGQDRSGITNPSGEQAGTQSVPSRPLYDRRPGSPVMPMGGLIDGGEHASDDASTSRSKRATFAPRRRFPAALAALSLLGAGGIGAAISAALIGSPAQVTTAARNDVPSNSVPG